MSDWAHELNTALASNDPAFMQAMLARVPAEVLQKALPYLQRMASDSADDGRLEESLTYYSQLIALEPGNAEWHASRARVHLRLDQLPQALSDATRVVELQPGKALGYRLQAEAHEGMRERPQAIAVYRQILRIAPNDEKSRQRIQFLESEVRKEALLKRTLDPEAAQDSPQVEVPPPPSITFDPALLKDPAIGAGFDRPMLEGLRQHLWRYSGQQSSKNALARLEDPQWLSAWDRALSATRGTSVLFQGSELGVFALRARKHGATRVLAVEPYPLDGRIASGVVQKNLLADWHALHGAAVDSWTQEQRRASFEEFAKGIDVITPQGEELAAARCDSFAFPNLDHSLLGTGIIKAIRRFRTGGLTARASILPARARLFAMAVQWRYATEPLQIRPLNDFRWSLYPQSLELPPTGWLALSEVTALGEIDFDDFTETHWDIQLPIITQGAVDAIIYWYELELGDERLSNAPDSPLQCIRPAVQYSDGIEVASGQHLGLRVHVTQTRLYIESQPAPARARSHRLPSWYVPMLLDQRRNDAYREALEKEIACNPGASVLDIGAGCGLLSMMAARTGASRVTGCEISPALAAASADIIKLNHLDERITIVNKDCRKLCVPEDLPERADLALFELFDCSLIGEGVLHFLAYAREHLLKENARYLPMGGRIRAMVIEYRLDRILQVDANLLNPFRFSPAFINVDCQRMSYRPLTAPFDVFSFDFSKATPAPEEMELLIAATGAGTAGAVLFWFDLQVSESIWLTNAPGADVALHWKQGLQWLPEVAVDPASPLPIIAKHDGSGLRFQWQQESLRKEALSALPRLDARSWQQAKELEYQTQTLLQHCMHNPEEYRKVAQLAQRFAIDPAAHDLDSVMANRFVAGFFI